MIVIYFYLRSLAQTVAGRGTPAGPAVGHVEPRHHPRERDSELARRQGRDRSRHCARCACGSTWAPLFGVALCVVRALEFTTLNVRWDDSAYGSVVWVLLGLHTFNLVTDVADTLVLTAVMLRQADRRQALRRRRGELRLLGFHRADLDTDLRRDLLGRAVLEHADLVRAPRRADSGAHRPDRCVRAGRIGRARSRAYGWSIFHMLSFWRSRRLRQSARGCDGAKPRSPRTQAKRPCSFIFSPASR